MALKATQFSRRDAQLKTQPFPMTQVRLLPGPFADAAEWNRGYMSKMPVDRLVRNFRVNAGLSSSATPLGGWEQPWNGQPSHRASELRGHFTGHFLSASALRYDLRDDLVIIEDCTGKQDASNRYDYAVLQNRYNQVDGNPDGA